MSVDLRTLKSELYSTPIDVLIMSANFLLPLDHSDNIGFSDNRIELALLRARGIIDLKLGRKLSGVSTMEVTPYAGPSLLPKADEESSGENSGTAALAGVTPASDAYTEKWTITFSSASAYDVTGSFSGSQGSGTISTDFESSNGDLDIDADAWSGTPSSGDKIYVPVYKHHRSIVLLATMLATGLIYKGIGSTATGTEINEGIQLYNDAMDLLDDVVNDKAGLLDVDFNIDTKDLMVPYQINYAGQDVSNYDSDEFNRFMGTTTNKSWPWWWSY